MRRIGYIFFVMLVLGTLLFGRGIWTDGSNGLIIQMDLETGIFGIGDTVGEHGRPLMFDFNAPWIRGRISHFRVKIDDHVYSNANIPGHTGWTLLAAPYYIGGGGRGDFLYAQWEIPFEETGGAIHIMQILEPTAIRGYGQCKIQYIVFNDDTVSRDVGLFLFQDIRVNENVSAPITAGNVYSGVGMYYSGNDVPFFWQAYEIGPAAGPDQLVAAGYLRGMGATAPEVFTFGDHFHLNRSYWDLDTASYLRRRVIDAATVIRWDQAALSPDKDVSYITYLGVGEQAPASDSLVMIVLAPSELTTSCEDIVPNPFGVSLLLHNQLIEGGARDITVCIEPPDGIELVFAEGHWPDVCRDLVVVPYEETRAVAWMCQLDSLHDFSEEPVQFSIVLTSSSIGYDITDSFEVSIPSPTGIPPEVERVFFHRFTSHRFDSIIGVPYLVTDDEGIDLTSFRATVNGAMRNFYTSFWRFRRDTLTVYHPTRDLRHGDTLIFSLNEVSDISGCYASGLPMVDTLVIDWEPPVVTGTFPASGDHIDTIPQVTFFVSDDVSGVDPTSVQILAEGDLHNYMSPNIEVTDSTITYTSSRVYDHREIFEIYLVSLSDNVDWGVPNSISEPIMFWFWADTNAVLESYPTLPDELRVVSIYPNPANASLTVVVNVNDTKGSKIEIFDIRGMNVIDQFDIEGNAELSKGRNFIRIHSDNATSGLYLFSVSDSEHNSHIKPFAIVK